MAVASRGALSFDVVRLLVEQEPPTVRQRNGNGLLPLHIAALHDAPLDVVFFLVTTDPKSISEVAASDERP